MRSSVGVPALHALFLQQHVRVTAGDHHLAGVEIGDVRIAGEFPGGQQRGTLGVREIVKRGAALDAAGEDHPLAVRTRNAVDRAPPSVARKRRRKFDVDAWALDSYGDGGLSCWPWGQPGQLIRRR